MVHLFIIYCQAQSYDDRRDMHYCASYHILKHIIMHRTVTAKLRLIKQIDCVKLFSPQFTVTLNIQGLSRIIIELMHYLN